MGDTLSFALLALSGVFFVVDPLGAVPIFIVITRDDPPQKRRAMALRASIISGALLAAFAVAGAYIFTLFGVTLGAFKAAGGILLLLTAVDMLRAVPSRTRTSPEEEKEGVEKEDVAVFPLATPILAGPGAIATVMVLMSRAGSLLHALVVFAAIAVTAVASWALLRGAEPIQRVLGRTGMSILHRVMGLVLAAIAVQFVFDGVKDAWKA